MKIILLSLLSMLIVSCDNNSSKSLSGSWETKSCEQAPAELGPHEGKYGKSIYTFSGNNPIAIEIQFFSGMACSEPTDKIEFNSTVTYFDLGSITLQEGIEGHEINLILPIPDNAQTIEGFYTINNSELCFSDIINFDTYSINSSESETDSIDFEKCLIQKQP